LACGAPGAGPLDLRQKVPVALEIEHMKLVSGRIQPAQKLEQAARSGDDGASAQILTELHALATRLQRPLPPATGTDGAQRAAAGA